MSLSTGATIGAKGNVEQPRNEPIGLPLWRFDIRRRGLRARGVRRLFDAGSRGPLEDMSNRAIVTSIVLSIALGVAIAAAFTWLISTDEPEQADRPTAVSTQ